MRSKVTLRVLVGAGAVVLVLAGCGGSNDSGSTDTDETPIPKVTSFEVGDLSCGSGATTAPAEVSWETENATSVAIGVDDFSPTTFGASGKEDITVPCDGESHEISIAPLTETTRGQIETEKVSG
jgi:hypothetical protein